MTGKNRSILRDQQGMALLITVMTVSLLVAVTIMFHRKSWQSYLVADSYKTHTQLKAIGDSGVNLGLALLGQDLKKNRYDSLLDSWAVIDEEELGPLFSNGQLELEIVDLSGRLQINRLVQPAAKDPGSAGENNTQEDIRTVLLQLLLSPSFALEEENEAYTIVDSLVDWIDEDERESDNGAESGYYLALEKPYECRNGPVQYIGELLLVKGISPELLFGKGEKKGLADYLTVYGKDGKININTVDSLLVKSLNPQISDELAEKFHNFRIDEDNEELLAAPGWYAKVDSWPGDIVLNEKLLTTQSTFFLIRSTGKSDSLFRRVTAVVSRVDEKTLKVISRKVE